MSYAEVPPLSVVEATIFVSDLRWATEYRYKDRRVRPHSHEVNFTVRLAALAYGRNSGRSGQYFWMLNGSDGRADGLEIQFHASQDRFNGAHAVLYIHRMQRVGAGLIITYKGSTGMEDWWHNVQAVQVQVSLSHNNKAALHKGFYEYVQTVTAKMHLFLFCIIVSKLAEWGAVRQVQTLRYLGAWLMNGEWRWCAVLGHSLGGGMAQIRAAELATRAKSTTVLLAILGSPSAGNEQFADILRGRILPRAGGVRIWNEGDPVPGSALKALLRS